MGAGYTCMKWLFIILNIIFLLLSIAGIGASIWMFVDPTIPLHFAQEANDYLISTIIILLASIILFISAILGIHSVSKEIRKALVVSFCLLLIIVAAEVAAGVWGYINRDSLEAHIRASVKNTVRQDYDKQDNIRDLFDTIQLKLECCGAEGPKDWTRGEEFNMGVSSSRTTYTIPESCCKPAYGKQECRDATQNLNVGEKLSDIIFTKGCYTLIVTALTERFCVIMIVGGVILAIQLLGLILGLILACSMKRNHQYKA